MRRIQPVLLAVASVAVLSSLPPAADLVPGAAAQTPADEVDAESVVRPVEHDTEYTQELNVTPDHEIDLKAGPVTPTPGLDPDLAGAEGTTWVVLQFQEEQPRRWLEALEGYDVDVAEDLTATAVAAGVPGSQLGDLAGEDAVRAIIAPEPDWKTSPALDRAREEGVIGPNTPARVHVYGFAPVEDARLQVLDEGDHEYVGRLTLEDVSELAAAGEVEWITYRAPPSLDLRESRRIVGAPGDDTPTAYRGGGAQWGGAYDGHGVTVGVVDSGFQANHPHFSDVNVTTARDFLDDDPDPTGPFDHGTHVAGTISGRTDPAGADRHDLRLHGVAPQADFVVSRAIKDGESATGHVDDWWDDVASRGDVEVIQNSWGNDAGGADYTKFTRKADVWARDHPDTLVVISNGNDDEASANSYGRAVNALTVSAVNDGSIAQGASPGEKMEHQTIRSSNVEQIHNTSPLLTNLAPPDAITDGGIGQIKPEILAPGEGIHAPSNNSNYSVFRGTSMAAPHVSGAAALLEDATDDRGWDLTSSEARALLVDATTPSTGGSGSYYTTGFGVVHAHDAIYNNSYEAESGLVDVVEGMNKKDAYARTIHVPDDATRVSATLSWLDPTKSSWTYTALSNNLWLFLGPRSELPDTSVEDPDTWDGSQWVDTSKRNVKKLVFEDPPSGEWLVGAYGREVTWKTDQPFDIAYSVETEEPGIEADTLRDPIRVRGDETRNVTLEVEGTGAPAAGVAATVGDLEGPLDECYVGDDDDEWGAVLGTLSQGRTQRASVCLNTSNLPKPGGGASQSYDAEIDVEWVDGSETVSFEVVRVEEDPPTNAENVRSPTHQEEVENRTWTRHPQVRFEWDEASDAGSGVRRYLTAVTDDRHSSLPLDPKPDYVARLHPNDTHPHRTTNHTTFWLGPHDNPDIPADKKRWANETPDAEVGEYWFHVRTQDEAGNLADRTSHYGPIRFDIVPPEPELEFSGSVRRPDPDLPTVAPVNESVTLDASGTTDDGDLVSFRWSIEHGTDDGGTAREHRTTNDTSHSFDEMDFEWSRSGTYEVEVTAFDEAGNSASVTREILVGDPDDASGAPGPGALAVLAAGIGAAAIARRRGS